MARRKQRRPRHFENPQDLAISLQNGIGTDSETEEDEHVCGKCRAEFPSLSDFLRHKKQCTCKRPVLLDLDSRGSADDDDEEDDEDDDDNDDERLQRRRRQTSAAAAMAARALLMASGHKEPSTLLTYLQQDTNVTLAELKNTTVAVAQRGAAVGKQAALREFFLRFQQKQVESLHLIQSIENIILKSGGAVPPPLIGTAALTPPQSADSAICGAAPNSVCAPAHVAAYPQGSKSLLKGVESPHLPPETNSLELLEKHAERYLQDSLSRRSFLLNGIDEDKSGKRTNGRMDDPAHRHRCHFCGKLLGSDSALQIHLRSHTGEKPFRCNVCGSSFSTRGNLKVHCQRHRAEQRMELAKAAAEAARAQGAIAAPELCPRSGQEVHDGANRGDAMKVEQALDFSTSLNGGRSPRADAGGSRSSNSPASDFSDNSADNSMEDEVPPDNYGELKIDVERFDDDDDDDDDLDDDDQGSNISNGLDDEMDASEASFGPSPTFAPYFLPASFPDGSLCLAPPSSQTVTTTSSATLGVNGNGEGNGVAADPTYYQDLLPRIGSNDNSWESLIEVTRTSETSKLQQLVDNIEHKLTDPNQCIICHRVLSCKSALQMHYRTHTGERPFKCKLCRRAFTTKGNLKTHMSVHRVKPPARVMHQCPVCHKQFANSVILQQHVRNHTGDGSGMPPLYPSAASDGKPPTLLPPSYPRQFLIPTNLMKPEPLALTSSKVPEPPRSLSVSETVIKATGLESVKPSSLSPATSSCSPVPHGDEANAAAETKPPILDLALPPSSDSPREKSLNTSSEISKLSSERCSTPEKESGNGISNISESDHEASDDTSARRNSPQVSESQKHMDAKIQNIMPISFSTPINASSSLSKPIYTTQANNLSLISLASDRPLPMSLPSDCPIPFNVHGPDRPYPPMSMPSCTTEYTASLAALENHVKAINSSVTHPLPFPPHFGLGINMANYYRDYAQPYQKSSASSPSASKNGSDASADDRSTPGGMNKGDSPKSSSTGNSKSENSGALDLTPRSSPAFHRPPTDMKMFTPLSGLPFPPPPHHRLGTTCRVCYKTFACQSALEIHYRSHTKERPFRCEVCDRGFSTKGNMRQHMLTHKIRDLPAQVFSAITQPNNCLLPAANTMPAAVKPEPTGAEQQHQQQPHRTPKKSPEEGGAHKRPSGDASLPLSQQPKRAPGQPKHLCQVCNKPFSSGSALQIHMRTHTGDKPFQCHICHRAFTTKGNLKVHMGTHMFNNSTSRRGRRMSLDLNPLQLQHAPPPGTKPMEFPPQARPDLFFPYLPAAYVNGLAAQPPTHQSLAPKMNEISVIQSAGLNVPVVCTSAPSPLQPMSLVTANNNRLLDASSQSGERTQGKSERPALPPAPQVAELGAWPWKISCNICSKICSSSTDLELHIRNNHCKKENMEASTESPRADASA